MNGSFYEQLGGVAGLFEQWGACERTVVACALARRVPWPGLRLLQRAVDAALEQARHLEDERLDREANDEAYLASLLAADEDDDDLEARLQKAVSLAPLVREAGARRVLVRGAGALVQRALDAPRVPPAPLLRQLLCYLLLQPAPEGHEHRTLTQWLRYLESHMGGRTIDSAWPNIDANIWGTSSSQFRRTVGKNIFRAVLDPPERFDSQESFSKNGRDVDISIESERLAFDATISQPKSQRSNSLTPPSTVMSSSAENLTEPFHKPRSFSLSSESSGLLRPRLLATAGSETRLDDLRSHKFSAQTGMSTVAQWLKGLRLHKYVWLFTNISYQQMMAIDEAYLEKLGVTKGARHKILLSISKLSERGLVLRGIEADLLAAGAAAGAAGGAVGAGRALERLRAVLLSPMLPDCDLAVDIVRLLTLASKIVSPGAEVSAPCGDADPLDPLSLHCWLVEKALHHEAFRRVELTEALRRLRHRLPPRQFYRHVGGTPTHRRHNNTRWRMSASMKPRGSWAGVATAPAVPRAKSHSYPPFPPPAPVDYSGLDALCLQMTEQAIN